MVHIETERLTIKNFCQTDWMSLQDIVTGFQASEYAVYDHEWPTSDEKIKEIAQWFSNGDNFLAVWLKGVGKLIGYISLNQTERKDLKEYDIGYCFNFSYHNKGYAKEGCRAMLSYAFNEFGADIVVTGTASDNKPSCNLLKKLGMKIVKENISSFHKTKEGKPIEFVSCSFAVTKEDWAGTKLSLNGLG